MSDDAFDLRRVFKTWPYDSDKDARIVKGDDGCEILQVRTPVGLEQYEMDGRPDGERPHGMESALEFHQRRLEEARIAGKEGDFELDEQDCAELFNEGTLYYFRYVRLFQLREWARTIRDTARNLRAFDFIHSYAAREEDREFLEKWRPYILRVNACAGAMLALDHGEHHKALRITNDTIGKIEALPDLDEETFQFERDRSLTALRELAAQIQKNHPLSEMEQLEEQLRGAIQKQQFERAAQLRDRLRELRRQHTC